MAYDNIETADDNIINYVHTIGIYGIGIFLYRFVVSLIDYYMENKFSFYKQYNQFYLEDRRDNGNAESPHFWTQQAFEDRLALESGILAVFTQSYGNIKGKIEVLDKPSGIVDYSLYDHIVEGGIVIESGILDVLDCPNSYIELSLNLNPGKL